MAPEISDMLFKSSDVYPMSAELEAALVPLLEVLKQAGDDMAQAAGRTAEEGAGLLGMVSEKALEGLEPLLEKRRRTNPDARSYARFLREALRSRTALAGWMLEALVGARLQAFSPEANPVLAALETRMAVAPDVMAASVEVALADALMSRAVGDAFSLRLRKRLRRLKHGTRTFPVRVANALRWVIRRDALALPVAVRAVPLSALARFAVKGMLPFALHAGAQRILAIRVGVVRGLTRMWQAVDEAYLGMLEAVQPEDRAAMLAHIEATRDRIRGLYEEALEEIVQQQAAAEAAFQEAVENATEALRRACTLAGTSELPRWRYRSARVARLSRRAVRQWQRLQAGWEAFYSVAVDRLGLSAEIGRFQGRVRRLEDGMRLRIDHNVRRNLQRPLEKATSQCRAMAEAVEGRFSREVGRISGASPEEIARILEALRTDVERSQTALASVLNVDTVQAIEAGCTETQTAQMEAVEARDLAGLVEGVAPYYRVRAGSPSAWMPGDPLPEVRRVEIPVVRIVTPFVTREITQGLAHARHRLWAAYAEMPKRLQDIWKIVRFNVESAIAELEGAVDAGEAQAAQQAVSVARDLACGGLRRVTGRLDALVNEIGATAKDIDSEIQSTLSDSVQAIQKELQKARAVDLRFRLLRRAALSRAETYTALGMGFWRTLFARIQSRGGQAFAFGQRHFTRLMRLMGLVSAAQEEARTAMDEADLDSVSVAHLPPVYRRLFRPEPLVVDDFLMGRSEAMDMIRQGMERWESGRLSALAVVGEVGSGKTSLLNCATQAIFRHHKTLRFVFRPKTWTEATLAQALAEVFELPASNTLKEIEAAVLKFEQPAVVVLEHGHQLFLRRIGGFEGVRQFLLLLSRTHRKVFWVLSMTEYAWRFLEPIVHLSEYFSYVIETRNMSDPMLEAAIMARHEVSGYHLRFLSDDAPARNLERRLRKASGEEAKQAVLRRVFFERLSTVSRGNVLIALFYWLRSIQKVEGDTMEVSPLRPFQFDFIRELGLDKLFTLAALLQHGTLNAAEHTAVFHTSKTSSQLLLDALAALNLIRVFDPGDGATGIGDEDPNYAINEMMRRPVVEVLMSRHILY